MTTVVDKSFIISMIHSTVIRTIYLNKRSATHTTLKLQKNMYKSGIQPIRHGEQNRNVH